MKQYLMTQSLLSAWSYMYNCADGYEGDAEEAFLKTLNREPSEKIPAQLDGIEFENAVVEYATQNHETEDLRWGNTYRDIASIVRGGQYQVRAYKDKTICGINFLLYAKADCVKAGKIYDIKYTSSYDVGKYLESPQHSMYFECIPAATTFEYLISCKKALYIEAYTREETFSIDNYIQLFLKDLESRNLSGVYFEKWRANAT